MEANTYKKVDARPVKRFFVTMLTRDIQIEDAILDLLDNCVDGILRTISQTDTQNPFDGYWAKITIDDEIFEIEDNCGGIPWSEHDKAFRMGRPALASEGTSSPAMTVGVYGIGMKRALFKLGQSSIIQTQNQEHHYQVSFTQEWINDENDWDLPVQAESTPKAEDGTQILIYDLYEDVKEIFNGDNFINELTRKIASHYAVIIKKGFRVELNGEAISANPIIVRFSTAEEESTVRPYMFKANHEGVEIFLAVGLREPIPGFDRVSEEQDRVQFSSDYAGWTVICNDRVVLYCDRSELTGWGIFNIPRYHTQFIAISGVVEFRGDPSKLPTTTTKRGLRFEASIYQQVLQRMMEGTRLFVDFTNNWKTMEDEAEKIVSRIPAISFSDVKTKSEKVAFNPTKRGIQGEQFKPNLPKPQKDTDDVRISFTRPKDEVSRLADVILADEIEAINDKHVPKKVGEVSFDYTYKSHIKND